MCLSVLQGLYLDIKATGRVPAVLQGKGSVLSTLLDAVDEACNSQLRTFFNGGRAAARAFFYRFIGYFLMNTSPKVYIRLVHPAAAVSNADDDEGSPYFAIEICHVGSATGAVAALLSNRVPAPAGSRPSGGSFTSVRSTVTGAGMWGLTATMKKDSGTDSAFKTEAGLYYPHVSCERLIKRTDSLYRLSRGLVQQLLKGNARMPQLDLVVIAKSFRIVVSGPAIAWTAADGGPMDHAEIVSPCKWWLLVPRPGTRSALDTKIQTLTVEEQHAHMHGTWLVVGSAGAAQPIAEAAEDEEEGDADFEDDVPLDCGGDMELDS